MEPIIISVPIYVQVSKTQKFALNLNQYRNAHFHVLNKAKVEYDKIVQPLIRDLPIMSSLKLTYSLFFGSKRAVDTSNICCIVDKFFSDSLVNAAKIPDDNTEIISDIHYRFGGIDTKNPRIDITIHDYEVVVQNKEEEPMRIILIQSEIEEAIKSFVLSQIDLKEGQTVQIDFKNTRGDDGATAEINISVPKVGTKETKPAPLAQPSSAQLNLKPLEGVTSTNGQTTGTATVQPVEEASTSTPQTAPADTTTASEPVVTVTPTNATTTPVSASTTAPEQVEAVVKPEAPVATKSLFAGLTKPVNS